MCINLPLAKIKETLSRLLSTKNYEVSIKEAKKKRSLAANAYFWTLVDKLSAKVGVPPKDIYRQFIPDVGGNCLVVPIEEESVEEFCELWCKGHIGRIAEDWGPCRNTPGYHNVRIYKSSSDYNTEQMSRLIQLAVDECRQYGIETMTPNEIARMVDLWRPKKPASQTYQLP